jgi:hypothetical protein
LGSTAPPRSSFFACGLLQFDYDELGGLQRGEPDHDIDDPGIDVLLIGRRIVTSHEVRLSAGLPGKRAMEAPGCSR